MRPVRRGPSPQATDFRDYTLARPYLQSRIGRYCSYCEIVLSHAPEVEHILPKSNPAYTHLVGTWQNLLLACKNCNTRKGAKVFALNTVLLPDRDNTFCAYAYTRDGFVRTAAGLPAPIDTMAQATLAMVGLDEATAISGNLNRKSVFVERVAIRSHVWEQAELARLLIEGSVQEEVTRKFVVELAKSMGHFSIWMAVFADDPDMLHRFVDAFEGTRASGCFDAVTCSPVSPSPNPDGLPDGGKL